MNFFSFTTHQIMKILFNFLIFFCFLNRISGLFIKTDEEANIIDGNAISIESVPYQVSLQISYEHFCGGAIISDMHIITAAHCIVDMVHASYSNIKVISGTHSLLSGGHSHSIERISVHPGFSGDDSLKNDISIIKLSAPIIFNDYQKPIKLPDIRTIDLSTGFVTGWGAITNSNDTLSASLKRLTVIILTQTQCQRCHDDTIYPEHICGFSGTGTGFGKGDSGSPLVVNGELVGIVSWTRLSTLGLADVYTRVSSFLPFISTNTKNSMEFN